MFRSRKGRARPLATANHLVGEITQLNPVLEPVDSQSTPKGIDPGRPTYRTPAVRIGTDDLEDEDGGRNSTSSANEMTSRRGRDQSRPGGRKVQVDLGRLRRQVTGA
jgi:hypothetical protein